MLSSLDVSNEVPAKKSDVHTFRGAFESVMQQHYPSLMTHITIRLVACPSICTEALGVLSSLSPYSFDASPSTLDIPNVTDVPIGAIPLLAVSSPDYQDIVSRSIQAANNVYHEFLRSEDGQGFSGQVVLLGDSMGSLLAYEALCRSTNYSNKECFRSLRSHSEHHEIEEEISVSIVNNGDEQVNINEIVMDAKQLLQPPLTKIPPTFNEPKMIKLDFYVSDFFMFGSPLSIVLAAKRLHDSRTGNLAPLYVILSSNYIIIIICNYLY